MERILSELNRVPGIQGSLIVGKDGIVILSDISDEIDEEEVSALAGSLILAAEKISKKLEQGELKSITLETNKSRWFIQRINIGFLLAIADANSNLGLLRIELRDAAVKLNNIAV